MNNVHYSSKSSEHNTPKWLVDEIRHYFEGSIDFDPCTNNEAQQLIQATYYQTYPSNILREAWNYRAVYMNPPYGRQISVWINKLVVECRLQNVETAIALVPARTDTRWFRLLEPYPILFLYGRLKFSNASNSAPFPNALAFIGMHNSSNIDTIFGKFGHLRVPYRS